MKLACIALFLGGLGCSYAQTPAATPPASAAPAAAGRAPAVRSNEDEGVSIDRFLRRPEDQPVHLSHGTLLIQQILGPGDPDHPGAYGQVLQYRKNLATAKLLPGAQTPLETYPDSYFFYVKSGEGRLDDGKQMWDLKDGIAIMVPPSVPHRLVNTSDKPLEMIMLQWTAGPDAKKALIVRNSYALPWCEENAHWNNASHCIFGTADGLVQGERIYTVMLPPWSVSQPHSHPQGMEEVWTKLSPGTIPVLIGSELREMQQNSSYLVPPTGKTDHSNLNLSKDKTEWFLYIARSPVNPNAPPRPQGQGGGFAANPNLSRDTTAATIAGRPLR
ncbi:cupin domain-containing protein [Terriglobus roseus]|uniref:Mannose-6-phosphate isomerase, cupin superfamily n=1 Tax=Terriglobus roseus TaxID=392734 RepID=A0A1H4NXE8_9BACT|nr:cupin domain-containing protein [Terriglobus roseus]SEB99332.1 Mannose-6-phosphate isomerase, cupin superfamily [Terriglobus roseus]